METPKFKRPVKEEIRNFESDFIVGFFNKNPKCMAELVNYLGVKVEAGEVLSVEADYNSDSDYYTAVVYRTREENEKEREARLKWLSIQRSDRKSQKIKMEEYERETYERLRKRFE